MDKTQSLILYNHPLVIPAQFLNDNCNVSLSSLLEKCLKGGWLRKWPRSLPLYSNFTNHLEKCCDTSSIRKWYSCQGRGGAHKRFFWIEQLTSGQWALRWLSNRKRSSESLILLANVTSISRGCDTEYLDSQTIIGCDVNCIFTLSSETSMQLEAESEQSTYEWITAISIVTYASRANLTYPYLKDVNFDFSDKKECIEVMKRMEIISDPARCRHLWRCNSGLSDISLPKIEPETSNCKMSNVENLELKNGKNIAETSPKRNYYELLRNIITDHTINTILLESNFINGYNNCDHTDSQNKDNHYKYCDVISNDKYQDFSSTIQKSKLLHQGISLLNVQSLNTPFVTTDTDGKFCKLTTLGFHWLMKRSENNIVSQINYHDICDKTLSQFLVASSHNTYLIGDQIGGSAEPSGLASALLRGCRCIELDVQDGPDGEPRLYHSLVGYKLSGYFTLRESLEAIKSSAFIASKLPVILSIQMKSSDAQKYTVYNIFTAILGDSIYVPRHRSQVANTPISDLCYKFIIKAKLFPQNMLQHSPGQKAWERIVALEGISLSNRESVECKIMPYHVCSMSENHFLRLLKSPEKLSQLSNACFVRLYPSGTRITSTNFCPLNPWSLGIHFVALNYQSCDRSMLINQGWFTNSLGYIPKPLDAFAPMDLSLHILSATQLPLLTIGTNRGIAEDTNLFVTISVVSNGYRNENNCVYKTSTVYIKNDSCDPIWADTTPPINIHVERPEYTVLVLQLKNGEAIGSGVLIGQASFPVYRILPGIRWVPLLDRRLRPISCSGILVDTKIVAGC